jgi:hypothetical protein
MSEEVRAKMRASHRGEGKVKRHDAQIRRWEKWREERNLPKEEMQRLYVDEMYGLGELGALYGYSATWARNLLKSYGIPIRSRATTKAQREAYKQRRSEQDGR